MSVAGLSVEEICLLARVGVRMCLEIHYSIYLVGAIEQVAGILSSTPSSEGGAARYLGKDHSEPRHAQMVRLNATRLTRTKTSIAEHVFPASAHVGQNLIMSHA
jgi:hypothetical protein